MRDILNLAYLRIIRNRKNSLLFFLVLLLSFASAIVSVAVVGSISMTNAEFRLDTYGTWYLGIPYGYESDKDRLSDIDLVDGIGMSQSIGTVSASEKIIGIGTIDEALIDIGRIRMNQGTFPSNENEIAMEMDSLSALGYDYTLGQEITVTVQIPLSKSIDGIDSVPVTKTYILCGIIHEYTDLWYLQPNKNNIKLNSAVISDTAAANLLADAEEMFEKMFAETEEMLADAENVSIRRPVCQYFFSVSGENRDSVKTALLRYLSGNSDGIRDTSPCVNSVAYSKGYVADYDDFYLYIIAILTFVSILCLEIIQLPFDTHSFSVLRSVGMSKGQLALMQILESLLMGIPAILMGLPLGAGLTSFALRFMLYSGSVDIQVYIPYEALYIILGLWFAAIIMSRLIIFVFTLRVPMIGRFQMSTSKSKSTKILRSGFIVLLLSIFSAGVIFTGLESLSPEDNRQIFLSYPSYRLSKLSRSSNKNKKSGADAEENNNLLKSDLDAVRQIPGISMSYGFSELYVGLSFNELSEEDVYLSNDNGWMHPYGMVYLLVIDENDWTSILDFGGDIDAFHNGEFVYVAIPDYGNEYPLPENEAVISIYSYTNDTINSWNEVVNKSIAEYLRQNNSTTEYVRTAEVNTRDMISLGYMEPSNDCELIGNRTVSTQVMYIPENGQYRTLSSIITPHTVICSEQFFSDLLSSLPEDKEWHQFTTGDEFAYQRIYAHASLNSDDLSTDIIIAEICKERDIILTNYREEYLAHVQENVQSLIMLYFSGACICIIALMILLSNVSLETKNEKHSFYIRRCIGMSKRQISLSIFGKSLLRCLGAFLTGWLAYVIYRFIYLIGTYDSLEEISYIAILKSVIFGIKHNLTYYDRAVYVYVAILLLGLVLPLILLLFAKNDLRKDSDTK